MTTLVITPTVVPTSFSLFQGNGVGTATELATTALPTQLVFDSSAIGNPIGAVTTGNAATASVSPALVGTAFKSTPPSSSTPSSLPTTEAQGSQYRSKALPIAAIILALVAAAAIGAFLLYLWYRKRARRRGHGHSRSHSGSEEYGTAPASDVFRKLGNYEKPADPFSDAHASQSSDPFADPPQHTRTGSDSFLSMNGPRAPYTHAPSASTGSSASSKARKREMEEARQRDMSALNNLVRALDQKDRQAQAEGRDRKSLPPVELFKAALVR